MTYPTTIYPPITDIVEVTEISENLLNILSSFYNIGWPFFTDLHKTGFSRKTVIFSVIPRPLHDAVRNKMTPFTAQIYSTHN